MRFIVYHPCCHAPKSKRGGSEKAQEKSRDYNKGGEMHTNRLLSVEVGMLPFCNVGKMLFGLGQMRFLWKLSAYRREKGVIVNFITISARF